MNDKNGEFKLQLPLTPLVVMELPTFSGLRRSKSCEQSLYLQKNHCMKGTNDSVLSLSFQLNRSYSPVQTTNGNNCKSKYTHLIVQNEDRNCFDSVLSNTSIKTYKDSHDLFPRIAVETLQEIICNNIHEQFYDSYKIIDNRFEYEFLGGHIKSALNISSTNGIESHLLGTMMVHNTEKPTLLIFHCEFGSHRGPTLASHLRYCDRIINQDNYPKLYYPDILLLDGGYEEFYNKLPDLCFPRNYVAMNSTEILHKSEFLLEKFRINSKKFISRNNSIRSFNNINLKKEYSRENILKFDISPKLSSWSPFSINETSGVEYEEEDVPSVVRCHININNFFLMKDLDKKFCDIVGDKNSSEDGEEDKVFGNDCVLKYHCYEDYPYNENIFNSTIPVINSSNRLYFHKNPTFE